MYYPLPNWKYPQKYFHSEVGMSLRIADESDESYSANSIGSTSSHYLWLFVTIGIGSSNFYVTTKSDNEKNFEEWGNSRRNFFGTHQLQKYFLSVCECDALMQCCRINLICQFSTAATGQKVVQMDQSSFSPFWTFDCRKSGAKKKVCTCTVLCVESWKRRIQ